MKIKALRQFLSNISPGPIMGEDDTRLAFQRVDSRFAFGDYSIHIELPRLQTMSEDSSS
jgi:hypothetical protein